MSDVSREASRDEAWEVCPKCANMDGGCPFCGHGYIRAYPGHEDVRENPIRRLKRENARLTEALASLEVRMSDVSREGGDLRVRAPAPEGTRRSLGWLR